MGDQFARIEQAPREPLSAEVAKALLEAVFSGQIQPGTRMPSERQLAESFGVGRFVVREALKSLGLLGLLEVRQGDGTYVRPPRFEPAATRGRVGPARRRTTHQ
ncbi:FadR/GntR family transcriptional regulator [Mycolicibacterium mageritense]|uniref:FadR/GntR family transcriptional regulator n=1 Tax=Mycolicibacterium mageritense TaxID=53462 RepID=UPI0027E3493F|nr:GntR family transcriptional regulator [Mycolicibacterium mageritense]